MVNYNVYKIIPVLHVRSDMWKKWRSNNCQPNFWLNGVSDSRMMFIVMIIQHKII